MGRPTESARGEAISHSPETTDKRELDRYYQSVFRRVITAYIDAKESGNRGGQLGATTGGVVRMCASDLICDVEKTARKALHDKGQYEFFLRSYILQDPITSLPKEEYDTLKHSVQTRLGREFESRQIFPLGQYMKPKDVRR